MFPVNTNIILPRNIDKTLLKRKKLHLIFKIQPLFYIEYLMKVHLKTDV